MKEFEPTRDFGKVIEYMLDADPELRAKVDAIHVRHQVIQDIYDARQRLGISQRTLAEISGVSESTISRIERVETTPRFSNVLKLAKALKVKLPRNAEASWKPQYRSLPR